MALKDVLQDIVSHTKPIGLDIVKITDNGTTTMIESMSEDRSVVLSATAHSKVDEFGGTFGMPNLSKLDFLLKNPEYRDGATINLVTATRGGNEVPVSLHFENWKRDFQNDYRFMVQDIINEKLKTVKFKGANWNIEFNPNAIATNRLKLQATSNTEDSFFKVRTDGADLVFSFGDLNTHAGSFVFESGIKGTLKHTLMFPISQVISILNLNGDATMKISDQGALQIIVDSGIAVYEYILPAMTK